MKKKLFLLIVSLILILPQDGICEETLHANENSSIDTMPFADYCKYYGYPIEIHKIETEDGYILTFYRI